jgi:hypothetical protein
MMQQQHYGAASGGMDSGKSNVLLVHIDDVEYTPTLDALHTVFKTYGHVHKMTIFDKGGHWQVCLWVYRADIGSSVCSFEVPLLYAHMQRVHLGAYSWYGYCSAVTQSELHTLSPPSVYTHDTLTHWWNHTNMRTAVTMPEYVSLGVGCRRWCSTLMRRQQSRPKTTWMGTACTPTAATRWVGLQLTAARLLMAWNHPHAMHVSCVVGWSTRPSTGMSKQCVSSLSPVCLLARHLGDQVMVNNCPMCSAPLATRHTCQLSRNSPICVAVTTVCTAVCS